MVNVDQVLLEVIFGVGFHELKAVVEGGGGILPKVVDCNIQLSESGVIACIVGLLLFEEVKVA